MSPPTAGGQTERDHARARPAPLPSLFRLLDHPARLRGVDLVALASGGAKADFVFPSPTKLVSAMSVRAAWCAARVARAVARRR